MELGLYTDSVAGLAFEDALDLAARVGATGLEIATGGQSRAPHLRLDELLADPEARDRWRDAIDERGLRLAALNCSAWPLHPVVGEAHAAIIRDTIRLAELLGVTKIVSMSGAPGDGPGSTTVNFVWYPWPDDAVLLLERQWDAAIVFWTEMTAFALDHGVERIAFELHPLHLVYNVPTLQRMRAAVGPIIGANLDPSHLFWMGMDPLIVARTLGPAVHHVHLKDTSVDTAQMAVAGVLDQRSFLDPRQRAWVFRTVGRGHGAAWWRAFVGALREAGYDDALAIEHEDAAQSPIEGVEEAAALVRPLLAE